MTTQWKPPPNLTVSQWADQERKLSPESSSEPGQWNTSRAPYQRGMMDAINNPDVETIAIMTSAQVGKTELLNNVVGFYVAHEPCPILTLQPTLEMAQTWSKDRLAPMLRDTPALQGKVKEAKSRNSGNTLLHKTFAGGHITMAGANSPASLASRPIRIVLCDEVDRYPVSAGTEGDPVSLARKRTNTFWNRKIILTSTPTIKRESRIEHEFLLSDQRHYMVPCPHCGESQQLKWSNIVFDKDDLQEAHYACNNGCVIDESHKLWMLKNGEWVATQEFNGRAGFHLSELYSPWRKWIEVVKDFLEMKGHPETLKTWTNTSLGETWEEKGDKVSHNKLLSRAENYDETTLPEDILVITAAIDVQGDRLEFLSQGWGLEFEHWDIEHKILWGDPGKPKVWQELDELLKKTYQCGGFAVKINCAVVDSGGHHTDRVYSFCKPRQGRRIFAIKGSSQYRSPVASRPVQTSRQRVSLYSIGTDTAKDTILFSWLNTEEPGPGYIHFNADADEEYCKQLTAEYRTLERGKAVFKKRRERNEILDLHVYNYGAYRILNPNMSVIKAKRKPVTEIDLTEDDKEAEPPSQRKTLSRQPGRTTRPRRNWATDI